ncbi:MAG: 50S ribosomal protein L15 [bacterium]|nr:50S ribosomal protein L15 [bacterium]
MELHTLKSFKGSTKRPKRVGRGHGSGHGTTATRGQKGQRARSGGRKGLRLKGMKQMLLRIPKNKGFHAIKGIITYEVNVRDLEKHFKDGETVDHISLTAKGIIKKAKGTSSRVKVLGIGTLTKKLTVNDCIFSASAREKIEKAGGTITMSA